MYERLKDKSKMTTMEEFVVHIGKLKEAYKKIVEFLSNEVNSENILKFDAHNRCWKINFYIKKEYVCDIIAEKDAFMIVTRLSDENIKK